MFALITTTLWYRRAQKWLRWSLWVFLVIAPVVVASSLLWTRHQATLWDLSPLWVDELHYWHQAKTFATAGLQGGYYSVAEVPSSAPFTRFYAWGMVIPAVYGMFAWILGWYPVSIPFVNLALVSMALVIFVIVVRPRLLQSLLLLIVVTSYPLFLMYYASSLIPLLQITLSLLVATGFLYLLKTETPRLWACLLVLFLIVFASTIRVTWAFLLMPYAFIVLRKYGWRGIVGGLALSVVGVSALIGWHWWTSAPFPNIFGAILATMQSDFTEGLAQMWLNTQINWQRLFEGDAIERWTRGYLVFLAGVVVVWSTFQLWRSRKGGTSLMVRPHWSWQTLFHIFNLGSLLIVIILYDVGDWRDLRLFAPRILLSLVVIIGMNQRLTAIVLLIPILLIVPDSLRLHDIWVDFHINPDRSSAYETWEPLLTQTIIYKSDAPDGWCNTLYHSTYYVFNQVPLLMSVAGGIGLSYPDFQVHDPPYKSRYLLLDDDTYQGIQDQLDLIYLADVPSGAIYENLSSAC